MADHGIRRVDGLVDGDAGKSEQHIPEHRRHDAVGRVLAGFRAPPWRRRTRPVARSRPTMRLTAFRARKRAPNRLPHVEDMVAHRFLGDEAGGEQRLHHPAEPPAREDVGDHPGGNEDGGNQQCKGHRAAEAAFLLRLRSACSGCGPAARSRRRSRRRMADRVEDLFRIAGETLDQHRERGTAKNRMGHSIIGQAPPAPAAGRRRCGFRYGGRDRRASFRCARRSAGGWTRRPARQGRRCGTHRCRSSRADRYP